MQRVLNDNKNDLTSIRRKKRVMESLSGSAVDSIFEKLIMLSYEEQGTPSAGLSQETTTRMIKFGKTPEEKLSD